MQQIVLTVEHQILKEAVRLYCDHKLKKAEKWYNKSIKEAPNLRDSYVEKALLEYTKKEYDKVIDLCTKALSIKNNNKYINESFSYD